MPEPTPAAQRELDAIDAALAGRPVEDDLADVAELARALQAERPEIPSGFARELDVWARGGFRGRDPRKPSAPSRRRKPRFGWLKLAAPLAGGLAAVVLAVAVLPGLLGSEIDSVSDRGSESSGASGGAVAPSSAQRGAESGAVQDEDQPGAARDFSAPTTRSRRLLPGLKAQAGRARGRQVERSASLALAAPPAELEEVAAGVEEVAAGVARVTDEAGGVVARSSVTADPDAGTATFDLRIPSARLSQTLAALSELAAVRSRTQASVDITRTVNSAAERLEEARAERRGLLRRLERDPSAATRARLRVVSRLIADAKVDLSRVKRR